jgi:hypothetical protein
MFSIWNDFLGLHRFETFLQSFGKFPSFFVSLLGTDYHLCWCNPTFYINIQAHVGGRIRTFSRGADAVKTLFTIVENEQHALFIFPEYPFTRTTGQQQLLSEYIQKCFLKIFLSLASDVPTRNSVFLSNFFRF